MNSWAGLERASYALVLAKLCVYQPVVTQQNSVRVKLQDIPEITIAMEGGEGQLGLFSLDVLKETA